MNQEEQNQQIQELFLLQRVAQRIISILELDVLLEEIVGDVAETFGYTRSGVLLKDDVTNELVIAAVRGLTTNYHTKGERFKIGEFGIVGHVAATGETYYAPDVTIDPYYQVSEELTRSEVDIPLKIRGRLIGVFSTQHDEVNAFSPERIQLLEALAGHIAAAIENARLFHRERLEKQRALVELDKAHDLKHSLFPKQSPTISRADSYKKMEREKWEQVKDIFDVALQRAPDERERFLAENCNGDEELRREVQSLLSSFDGANSFLQKPAVGEIAETVVGDNNHLVAGQRFSHYEIIRQIGTGGMGEVYLAEDARLRRKIAVKVLLENIAEDKDRLRRFEQEAFAASALNHPNILTIYEFGAERNVHFLAAEFVEGETLRERMRRESFSPGEVLDIAAQVAAALNAAHRAGIVHRDIKPENIMLREDGLVKVLDFGLAKLSEKQDIVDSEGETLFQVNTVPGMLMGTVAYMSPEQARGKGMDARSDVWSLGCVLYEMLAGRQPFAGETTTDVLAIILHREPAPLSEEVPPELNRIVQKVLRKDKNERYQTIKDLLIDLKALQKRLNFEAELERASQPNKQTEADTQIFKVVSDEKSQSLPPNNLTENLSPLIGREKEIAEIKNLLLLDDVRLLTMTGIGGTGKTTLAQAAARALLKEFSDGVFFAELAAVTNAELVISTIALSLGVKEAGGKPILEILKDYLRGRQMLIVVDNFEQVIDAAPQIAELLSAAKNLKILITSRVLLRLSAEREFVVPPLAVPADVEQVSLNELQNYEAVKLFVERASSAKANFALTDENARSVAEICTQLDGLPLAIELAAVRVKILSPQMILSKLENRLQLLTGGARDLPARQQTMRGAVEWSYELLTDDEKRLYRRLAVFAGGFTLEAAEAVCANYELRITNYELSENQRPKTKDQIENLDLIASLVDKSLLATKEQADGETRFRMLEVVREYANESLEQSGEAEAARRHHAEYFVALGEKAKPHLTGAESVKWLNRLEEENDNLRGAIRWLLEHDAQKAARLAAALRIFWNLHSKLAEGRGWLEAVLESESLDALSTVRVKLLNGLGQAARNQGDYEAARKAYQEGLTAGRAANDLGQIAYSLRGLGAVANRQDDFTTARKLTEEALAISRRLNDEAGVGFSLYYLGDLARAEGDDASARPLLTESLTIFRRFGNKEGVSANLNSLGAVAYGEGDFAAARSHFAEALATSQELQEKTIISFALEGFAALAAESGDAKRAVRLAGAADELREQVGFEIEPFERRFRDAYLAELKTKMDETAFAASYEQGLRLKLEEAIALALAETGGETETEGDGKLQGKATNETGEVQVAILSPATTDAQETTATATEPDSQVPPDKPKTKQNLLLLGLLSLFILTVGFFTYRSFAPSRQIESIAVMPFVNARGNADAEYLSDGMTETLIKSLLQVPNLAVKSRSTVFYYKGREMSPKKMGEELGVQAVLLGTIGVRGDDLRLNLELVNTQNENVIWSEQSDRKQSDLVSLQSEIAKDVSTKLKAKLSGAVEANVTRSSTTNPEAYQAYLKGRYYWNRRTAENIKKAIELFKSATDRDPNYALAYTGLADSYVLLPEYAGTPISEALPQAKAYVERAIAIDDQLAEPHATLGLIHMQSWQWEEAERQFKRAIELNPDYATAYH